jgi:hypothetical protein
MNANGEISGGYENAAVGAGAVDSEFRYTELTQTAGKSKRGRKPSPDAQTKKTLSLRPSDWSFIERWAYEGDYSDKEEGEKHWNPSPALGRCLEDARRMFPLGPSVGRPRGEGGRFMGANPSPVRATRPQLQARIKALETRLRAAGLEVE